MEMSGFEAQARILHQSNQIRDEVKSLHSWEQDMKSMEMKRKAVPDADVSSYLCIINFLLELWHLKNYSVLGIRSQFSIAESDASIKTVIIIVIVVVDGSTIVQ